MNPLFTSVSCVSPCELPPSNENPCAKCHQGSRALWPPYGFYGFCSPFRACSVKVLAYLYIQYPWGALFGSTDAWFLLFPRVQICDQKHSCNPPYGTVMRKTMGARDHIFLVSSDLFCVCLLLMFALLLSGWIS